MGPFFNGLSLSTGWDVTVFLDTSEDVSERRGVDRDAERLGEPARPLAGCMRSGIDPLSILYERSRQPRSIADVIVDNNEFDRPHMSLRSGGVLSAYARP